MVYVLVGVGVGVVCYGGCGVVGERRYEGWKGVGGEREKTNEIG